MFARLVHDALFLLCVASVGLCVEIFLPREKASVRDRLNGFLFWPFLIVGQAVLSLAFYEAMWSVGVRPFSSIEWLPAPLQIVVAILCGDFLYYWYHRAQHQFLWRFHSVHHSIEHISSVNTYHHWLEPAFMTVLFVAPLYLLGVRTEVASFGLFWILRAQTYLVHSPTKLHAGPLSRVILDNRFHRIHHSLEARHFDRNFGMITPLWDALFGTAYWPAKNEWPAVGLVNNPEPRSLKQWFGWRLTPHAPCDAGLEVGDPGIAVEGRRS